MLFGMSSLRSITHTRSAPECARAVLISGRGWDSQALKAALTQLSDVGFHLTEAPTLIQNTLLVAGCSTCFLIANDADATHCAKVSQLLQNRHLL